MGANLKELNEKVADCMVEVRLISRTGVKEATPKFRAGHEQLLNAWGTCFNKTKLQGLKEAGQ